ncbi:MAG: hypothetical protein K1X86_08315 [Ignavibacteria bacterium]|nr:hypothetical protein [Ignavibacteria bacterium]
MFSIQTIEILKSLNKNELKRLGDFIKSPYFNSSKPIEKIFTIVFKSYPDFDKSALHFKKVFKKLYPSEAYNEKRMKNMYSEFSNLLRKFIGFEHLRQNNAMLDVPITAELTARGLNKISEKLIAKSLKENDDGLLSIADRFHYLYPLNVHHTHNLGYLREHGTPEYLKADVELIEKLIIFFLTNIHQLSFYDVTNNQVFKMPENPILKIVVNSIDTEKILAYFDSVNHEYASYLKIHYLFWYHATNDIDEEKYRELKKEILKTIRKVKKLDQNQFIVRIIHMIISKFAIKDRKFYEDVIEFAELIDELKIFPGEDVNAFFNGPFRDIFITAVSLKKYDWAENFLNKYIEFVSRDLRKDSENFCRGILSFKRGNFEESLKYFNEVKMIDIVEKLNVKFYYIMNYIELKSYESALSALHSFKQFMMESDAIPEMFSERVKNSLKYFAELIRCEEKGEKISEWVYKEFKQTAGLVHKQYLLEKIEKLM